MNVEQLTPFIMAVKEVLEQFGVTDIKKEAVFLKEEMVIDQDVTAFVGLVGDMIGNVSYCFSNQTAKKIASAMMMGMPVEVMDEMTRSALAELSNMITGHAVSVFSSNKVFLDITPPTLVAGEEMYFILAFLNTYKVVLNTSLGNVEVNIALEI